MQIFQRSPDVPPAYPQPGVCSLPTYPPVQHRCRPLPGRNSCIFQQTYQGWCTKGYPGCVGWTASWIPEPERPVPRMQNSCGPGYIKAERATAHSLKQPFKLDLYSMLICEN